MNTVSQRSVRCAHDQMQGTVRTAHATTTGIKLHPEVRIIGERKL
ncbi:MAG: hypothetical protein NUV63_06080 [Gallionella sp.]|nr:hypothetical protein [Gallionella sp.]